MHFDYNVQDISNSNFLEKPIPYRAKNLLSKSNVVLNNINELENQQTPGQFVVPGVPITEGAKTGYLLVNTQTALGALPVANASVKVFAVDEKGTEHILVQETTDISGKAPLIELPVIFTPGSPLESYKYFFAIYNMKVEAQGFLTVNVIHLRIFPETTTIYRVDMVPTSPGDKVSPDKTIIITPNPIDLSNF